MRPTRGSPQPWHPGQVQEGGEPPRVRQFRPGPSDDAATGRAYSVFPALFVDHRLRRGSSPQVLVLLVLDHAVELAGQPLLGPLKIKVGHKSAGIADPLLQLGWFEAQNVQKGPA